MEKNAENNISNYLERLLKLIPTEVVLVYATILPFLPEKSDSQFTITLIMLVITPFYLTQALGIRNKKQVIVSTLAFVVWVFYLGGPFNIFGWYEKWMAGAALMIFSLIPPILFKSTIDPAKYIEFLENKVEEQERKERERTGEFEYNFKFEIDNKRSWREI